MTSASLSNLGALLGGIAALLTIMFAIGVKVAKCISDRSTRAIISATTASVQAFIAGQLMRSIEGRDTASYYTLDMRFPDGQFLHVPMIPGMPLMVLENISISVISHSAESTILSLVCVGYGHISEHCHAIATESIRIERGLMTDQQSGRQYRAGDEWRIEAGEFHAAYFHDCVAIITLRPSLPTAAQEPVNLTAMKSIFR